MRISIKRSGGFSGVQMPPKILETDDEEMKLLAREVVASASDNNLVDGMQYDITIEEDGKETSARLFSHGEDEKLFRLAKAVIK